MIEFRGIYFPEGETHLPGWMQRVPHMRGGKATYQYTKYEAAMEYVEHRSTAVDIGAHIGLWSRVMAMDFARVEAFEPVQVHRQCWEMNVHAELMHGSIRMHPVALGEKEGTVSMRTGTPGSCGDTWVARPGEKANAATDVPIRRLDSFNLTDVDLVKVDNEGYEYFALRGGEEMLKRERPVVIVEQKPGRAQKFGIRETEAVEYLKSLGASLCKEISGDYILKWF